MEHTPGCGSELFIVEGDSAAKSVRRLCNMQLQAVVPMQGKPLNAYKAKSQAVASNKLYQTLLQALGCESLAAPKLLRYDRIIFLFDPDADGIHIGALMLLFFYRWLRWARYFVHALDDASCRRYARCRRRPRDCRILPVPVAACCPQLPAIISPAFSFIFLKAVGDDG